MGEEKKESGGDAIINNNNVEEKKQISEEDANATNDMILIKVDMHCHCEACAKKIVRALRTSQGVEDVAVNRKTNMVAIKGKEADPLKLCDRISQKTGRKAQLVSPLPKPPPEQPKDDQSDKEQKPKKDEAPHVVRIVLGVNMHCEACAQLLRKRIRKLKGVESVETDVGKGEVIVKGVIEDPKVLVEYVHKRTRKQVTIVKDCEEHKQDSSSTNEQQKKQDDDDDDKGKGENNNSHDNGGEAKNNNNNIIDDAKMMMMMMMNGEMNRSYDYYYYYSPSASYDYMEYHHHNNLNYLSDENPNACSIM